MLINYDMLFMFTIWQNVLIESSIVDRNMVLKALHIWKHFFIRYSLQELGAYSLEHLTVRLLHRWSQLLYNLLPVLV